jgi:hypothetical protein
MNLLILHPSLWEDASWPVHLGPVKEKMTLLLGVYGREANQSQDEFKLFSCDQTLN